MTIDAIETLWINAQRTNTPEGAKVSKSEADQIIAAITSGGIQKSEVAVVDQLIKQLSVTSTTASADAELAAMDLGMSGATEAERNRTAARNGNLKIDDVVRMTEDLRRVGDDGKATSHNAAHTAHLLRSATYIREQVEIARRIPTIVDKLSYGAFDWAIFDGEAKAALREVEAAGDYAHVIIRNLATRNGGKFLKRLVDQLPDDGKRRLWKVMDRLDAETKSTAYKRVGRGLWAEMKNA